MVDEIRADQRYCRDCGKVISERAEICVGCGCRQRQPQQVVSAQPPVAQLPPLAADPLTGRMVMLVGANMVWPGLGNLLIGDSSGWAYGIIYWLIIVIGIFTFGIPNLLYWIITCFTGREFLKRQLPSSPQPTPAITPAESLLQAATMPPIAQLKSANTSLIAAGPVCCARCGTEGIEGKPFCTKCGSRIL